MQKIAEDVYNRLGWILSDRDRMIIKATMDDQPELYAMLTLNEREQYLIQLAKSIN